MQLFNLELAILFISSPVFAQPSVKCLPALLFCSVAPLLGGTAVLLFQSQPGEGALLSALDAEVMEPWYLLYRSLVVCCI